MNTMALAIPSNGPQKVKEHQENLQSLALNDLDAEEVGKVVQ